MPKRRACGSATLAKKRKQYLKNKKNKDIDDNDLTSSHFVDENHLSDTLFNSDQTDINLLHIPVSNINPILNPSYLLEDPEINTFFRLCVCADNTQFVCVAPQIMEMIGNLDSNDFITNYVVNFINPNWNIMYIPYNIAQQHWILLIVQRLSANVLIVDTNKNRLNNYDAYKQGFVHKVKVLVDLIMDVNGSERLYLNFSLVRGCPIQEDNYSCGAWVCYLGLQHFRGVDFSLCLQTNDVIVRQTVYKCLSNALGLGVNHVEERENGRVLRRGEINMLDSDTLSLNNLNISTKDNQIDYSNNEPPSVNKVTDDVFIEQMKKFHEDVRKKVFSQKECSVCHEGFIGMKFEYETDSMCRRCKTDKSTPKLFSKDNNSDPGNQPEELKNLTVVEQMLISPLLPSCQIFNIQGGGQRGGRGHVITFPQQIQSIATALPHTKLPIVLFEKDIGNSKVYLRVRRHIVENALKWLIANNPHFRYITLNEHSLSDLPIDGQFQGFHSMENVEENNQLKKDPNPIVGDQVCQHFDSSSVMYMPLREMEPEFRKRLLNDVLKWPPVDSQRPVSEFTTHGLFAKAFPHLFPTGSGDFSSARIRKLTSLGDYFKHIIRYHDPRFRQDERFLYFAMNMMFRWRALENGNLYMKQHPDEKKLSAEQILQRLDQPGFLKKVMAFSQSLHGSQSYWYNQCNRVESMCKQLGPPTFFVTLSAADTYWPDVQQLFGVDSLSEMCNALRKNPVTANTYFIVRAKLFISRFFHDFLLCNDSYFRVEYQHRGSPHVHGVIWLPNAPQVMKRPYDCEEIKAFADQFLSTWNIFGDVCCLPKGGMNLQVHPASIPFADVTDIRRDYGEIVNSCMRHTKCRQPRCLIIKNGKLTCRFGFPKEKMNETKCMALPRNVGLNLLTKRNDTLVVSHCPQLTVAWRGNCEMQMIVALDALLRYLLKYLNKPEPVSEALLKIRETVALESSSSRLTSTRIIQSVLISTIGNRDFSAQESAHHLLQMPLFFCSRQFVVLNTSCLRRINNKGTKVCILDIYKKRNSEQENVCLFEFVKCFNNNGKVRRKEVIVQIKPRYTRTLRTGVDNDMWFEQQIILFLPWRGNNDDLKGTLATWKEVYDVKEKKIKKSQRHFGFNFSFEDNTIPNEEDILLAEEPQNNTIALETEPYQLAEHEYCHPQHAHQEEWMAVQSEPARNMKEGKEEHPKLSNYIEFLDYKDDMDWQSLSKEWNHIHEIDKFLINQRTSQHGTETKDVQYQSLNTEQRVIFNYIIQHSQNSSLNKESLRAVVLGKAGTGKSHLLFALRTELNNKCILLAPTGVAACNIQGSTIHSKLCIPVSSEMDNLKPDALSLVQDTWRNIEYIFIDEVSMIGQTLLGKIDRRLREIFSEHSDIVYGGRSVIFFGDFGQLPPVCDQCLYDATKSNASSKNRDFSSVGRLSYMTIQKAFFLETIVRQDKDIPFLNLLLRFHEGIILKEDWSLLCQRSDVDNLTAVSSPFEHSLRLFPTLDLVFQHNLEKLKQLKVSSEHVIIVINAEHPYGGGIAEKSNSEHAGGLEAIIAICIGARVMLVHNLWVQCGLVNGSVGTVRGIVYKDGIRPPSLPLTVLVEFDKYQGPCLQPNNVVPITCQTTHWNEKGRSCARTQLPLTLCWATTIHKSQGLTLDKVVIHLGNKDFCPGLTYVALSRVRRLTDLCVYPMDFSRLQAISKSTALTKRINEENRLRILNL